jgi:hypothetical protein
MTVSTVENINVQIQICVGAESPQKFFDEFKLKMADWRQFIRSAIMQKRPAAEVDGCPNQSFIHGKQRPSVTAYPRLISQGLGNTFAEDDAGIFDTMMEVDLQIAAHVNLEIEQAVFAEELEHVIEKGNARLD